MQYVQQPANHPPPRLQPVVSEKHWHCQVRLSRSSQALLVLISHRSATRKTASFDRSCPSGISRFDPNPSDYDEPLMRAPWTAIGLASPPWKRNHSDSRVTTRSPHQPDSRCTFFSADPTSPLPAIPTTVIPCKCMSKPTRTHSQSIRNFSRKKPPICGKQL